MSDFVFEQVGVHFELSEEEKFYRNALTRMPDGPAALEEAYNAVKENVSEVEQYVKVMHILLFRSLFSYILLYISWPKKKVHFLSLDFRFGCSTSVCGICSLRTSIIAWGKT